MQLPGGAHLISRESAIFDLVVLKNLSEIPMDLLLILLIVLLMVALYRLLPVFRALRRVSAMKHEAQRRYQEQQEHRRATERTENPPRKSEDLIKGANLDLEGGEYVDYEEVKDSN